MKNKKLLLSLIPLSLIAVLIGIFSYIYYSSQPKVYGSLRVNESNPELEKAVITYQMEQAFAVDPGIDVQKTRGTLSGRITLFGYDDKYAYIHYQCSGTIYYLNSNIPPSVCSESPYKQDSPFPSMLRFEYSKEGNQYIIKDRFNTTEYLGEPSITKTFPKKIVDVIKKDGRFSFAK